jgi:hypothetical protein
VRRDGVAPDNQKTDAASYEEIYKISEVRIELHRSPRLFVDQGSRPPQRAHSLAPTASRSLDRIRHQGVLFHTERDHSIGASPCFHS